MLHRSGSHTISPYTPRMTNPLSLCHILKSLRVEQEAEFVSEEEKLRKISGY